MTTKLILRNLLAGLLLSAAAAHAERIDLSYHFSLEVGTSVPVPAVMQSSDRFRLEIDARQDLYAYVLFGSNGKFTLVVPNADATRGTRHYRVGKKNHATVPPPSEWLELDDEPGVERIWLVAGRAPIEAFENTSASSTWTDGELLTLRSEIAPKSFDLVRRVDRDQVSVRLDSRGSSDAAIFEEISFRHR